jgi:Zn-finger nucleic acid-binding protein
MEEIQVIKRAGLVCPKCGHAMLEFERTGILVEQCQECRGIFLDYGELERLIDAEGGGWSGRVGPPTEMPVVSEEALGNLRDLFGEEPR